MTRQGLVFLMNQKPKYNDLFILRKIYRYKASRKNSIKFIIELELFKSYICVVSFYQHNRGNAVNRYRIRQKTGTGQVLSIMKACLDAFYKLEDEYAFVFNASNDIGEDKENNARYSAYKLFMEQYFKDYKEYIQFGTMRLNILMLYHQSFQYKDEANQFYRQYEGKIQSENNL